MKNKDQFFYITELLFHLDPYDKEKRRINGGKFVACLKLLPTIATWERYPKEKSEEKREIPRIFVEIGNFILSFTHCHFEINLRKAKNNATLVQNLH